jgi:hypothetical protein
VILLEGEKLPEHISYSSLMDYLSCGYLYYLSRVRQEKETPAWWLYGGISVHRASELYDFDKWREDNDK